MRMIFEAGFFKHRQLGVKPVSDSVCLGRGLSVYISKSLDDADSASLGTTLGTRW